MNPASQFGARDLLDLRRRHDRVASGASVPPTTLMPRDENAVFYQLFLQTPGAVSWYRNVDRSWEQLAPFAERR